MPQRSRRKNADWFLLMSLPVVTRFYRFQPFLLPPHISRAIDETVSFVGELSASSEVHLRSSGDDVFPMEKLGQSRARVVSDVSGGKGSVAASRAKLVIHNYFGTSWLETLAMNVPTVCFVPEGIHRFRAAAQPFVDALVRVGIIHYSGREAARFVNTFHGDPSSWWKSADVQEAREAFVARYANFSDNWLEAWQEEFESLLAE
jgi:putative transferase (TIGR04331 family)